MIMRLWPRAVAPTLLGHGATQRISASKVDRMSTWTELKRRKIVQWGLAYLAGAWVMLQLVNILAGPFGLPVGLQRGITVLLAFGLPIALVVAWYHGEQGRQRVSGPELLMVAALLVGAGAAIAFVRGAPAPEAMIPEVARDALSGPTDGESIEVFSRSVAVLPLDDHSPSGEHGYFAEAMTEELTTALSKVPELRVPSRNSASKFPQSGLTVREFARQLGVAHVLEGSVRRAGDRVRITVQLIDARADEHVWSETYDRDLTNILEAQVEIARQVADRLAATFTERERARIVAGSTQDPVAYDHYLRAWQSREPIPLLRQAVERDPGFALAWGELGGLYYWERVYTADDRWNDSIRFALDRAVELTDDPSLELKYRAWKIWSLAEDLEDLPETIGLLRQAVDANPGATELIRTLAFAYESSGDLVVAARWIRRWTQLDPLNPWAWSALASQYMRVGLDEHAERAIGRAHQADPQSISPWVPLQWLRLLQGRYREALTAVDSLRVRGHAEAPLEEGIVHTWADAIEAARDAFDRAAPRVARQHYWSAANRAHGHLLLGDTTAARAVLSRARAMTERAPTDPWARYHQLAILGVLGDVSAATEALRHYSTQGGREARLIRHSPLFSRVRHDPAFQAELAELERIVAQQRREIERDLLANR
jgi:TolB-like protein/Tfp pilus assembly protein PilF